MYNMYKMGGGNNNQHRWEDRETGLIFSSTHVHRKRILPAHYLSLEFQEKGKNPSFAQLNEESTYSARFGNVMFEFAHMEKDKLPQ